MLAADWVWISAIEATTVLPAATNSQVGGDSSPQGQPSESAATGIAQAASKPTARSIAISLLIIPLLSYTSLAFYI